ncbi:MAG: elongation factor G [Bacillota bacterium]|nr:elongation factor G [Bacillota bacterium]
MKQYPVKDIRNVALLAHGGDGKTTLAEAMLYISKGTDRFGKISEGNTVGDYDSEEIKRQISISTTVIPVEWKSTKINLLDTPGYFDFVGEVVSATRVADGALILVTGKSGVQVGTEKSWKFCIDAGIPRAFFISKIDEENSDFYNVIEQLKERFGASVCPIEIPMFENDKVSGYVNLIELKARKYEKGTAVEVPVPESLNKKIEALRGMINEAVAETSEENLDKFFSGEQFTPEEIISALKMGVSAGSITPVLCGSAFDMSGIDDVLDMVKNFFPSPLEGREEKAKAANGEEIVIKPEENAPLAALVFKTIADPFVGKMSYFKVLSGVMKADSTVQNANSGAPEKVGKLYFTRGKKQIETAAVGTGDIGAVTKLAGTNTGDTLCTPSRPVTFEGIDFPAPCFSQTVTTKTKGDDEKISLGLQRLMEEDRTFKFRIDKETKQQLISGMGDVHLDVLVSKLKNKFGTVVELKTPRVPYRETIKKKVKVEGKHKKQSGGHGQYGHVWIEFEPGESEGLTFTESVFGGAVPRNFFPAVEKGLQECISKGVLAGYPVVHLKATLVDGSYHPVDSSEMAFKVAASLAYKTGLTQASPILLEPIGNLKVFIPESYMGDIIGDINKRRGRILGMNPSGDGMQTVEAEVPSAEMNSYAIDLRSMTGGRGSFSFKFERYEEAPANVAQKVIEDTKARAAAENNEEK